MRGPKAAPLGLSEEERRALENWFIGIVPRNKWRSEDE